MKQVFLNGTRVPIKDFSSYVDLYLKDKPDAVKIHEKNHDRWEVRRFPPQRHRGAAKVASIVLHSNSSAPPH
jgi:hypothetical protein